MDRAQTALEFKHSGSNCAQAVLLAFADEMGMEEQTLRQLGAAFGGGMGCMEATCGALCAAQMVLGRALFRGAPLAADARTLLARFHAQTGAVRCRDLKGLGTGRPLCSCDECVRIAAELVQQRLEESN